LTLSAPPKLREALVRHFKDEARAEAAVAKGDLASLAKVDGLSERKALELVRKARGEEADTLAATPQARALLDSILEQAASHAATPHGRSRIKLLAPQPTPAAASRHAAWVLEQKQRVAGLDRDRLRHLLRAVRPPAEPPARFDPTRLVIGLDGEEQDHLVRLGVNRWAQVGGPADLERAADADLVLLAGSEDELAEALDNAHPLGERPALDAAAPEAVLAWFETNRAVLEACAGLADTLGKASPSAQALAVLATRPAKPADAASARKAFDALLKEMQATLQQRVASVSITGQELLDSLGRKLPAAIRQALDATLAEAKEQARLRTGLTLQPFTATLPLALDEEELERVERDGASRSARDHHLALAKLAKRLAVLRAPVSAEIEEWQAFDVPFALGCFALACDLDAFAWDDGLAFDGGLHLGLAGRADAQRIGYHLGGTETIALLTGANSGGKTTLLELVGQACLMARLGLPVAAKGASLPWLEELHLLTARRTLDAGAFESFLRTFLPLAQGGAKRLVLADEVEAVTELEAAGRILGFFLDRLARTESLAIVVTHMAPHILRHTTAPIRVDGIEATGLDAENRLVVDRQPRLGHLARSTPEFIVQRLAASAKGADKALFQELLATFRLPDAAPAPPRKLRGTPASAPA
jgi:hypothetical protein